MVAINQTGTAGALGSTPSSFGPGGPGGAPGQTLDVVNAGNGADLTNTTTIRGGAGGSGGGANGAGGHPETGGNAGNPAGNGTAITRPTVFNPNATIVSKATGFGGAGGAGGHGTYGAAYGTGGNGGNGYASSYAANALNKAYAYGYAYGGTGGSGSTGGNGGIGQIGTVTASGTWGRAVAVQAGGAGGVGFSGNGGDGQSSTLINAVGGSSEGADLILKQTARGGAGGASVGAQAGTAGNATSELTFDDTTNPTPSTLLGGYVFAYGGRGGSASQGGTPTPGGNADAILNLTGASGIASLNSLGLLGFVYAAGGAGGALSGTPAQAAGGNAVASDTSFSNTTGTYSVTAATRTAAGSGANGGLPGQALGATAKAEEPNATGGLAYAHAGEYGGNGGVGTTNTPNGQNGGSVVGTYAYASGHSAEAVAVQVGGVGGLGAGAGSSGAGAQSILNNAVNGRSTGGTLRLRQQATGGNGAESGGGGLAGVGGYGKSSLTFNDITANPVQASSLYGYSYARGGPGGQQGGNNFGGANGANANSTIHFVGKNNVKVRSVAYGGGGGQSSNVLFPGPGGSGGTATVTSAYAYSATATATAYGVAEAGAAGAGAGAANSPGAAGLAIIGTDDVTAVGLSATAVAAAYGGNGGYGAGGANGTQGAEVNLTNAAFGASYHHTLTLKQRAVGGAGGGAGGGGAAARGGNAISSLTFDDNNENGADQVIASAVLVGYVKAIGGVGGSAYGTTTPSTPANGGTATAYLKLTAYHGIDGQGNLVNHGAVAWGGYGGNEAQGNAANGGVAQATDLSVSSTTGSDFVSSYARTLGGHGGGAGNTGTGGNGGAGGAATLTKSSAKAPAQTGEVAYARSVATSGAGGTGDGSGKTSGNGGAVNGATAYAFGYSARAVVTQYGGAGGSGNNNANGGAGANSLLNNAASGGTNDGAPATPPPAGTTDGGYLTLNQTSHGGAGGVGNGAGSAGSAGYGYSILNFDDSTANTYHASILNATITGYGGNGGVGNSVGSTGGAGKAQVTLEGYGQVNATAKAEGGEGSDSATGGNALADATATGDGVVGAGPTATATATATAIGGFTSGTMGAATANAIAATSDGQQATATGVAYGTGPNDQTSAQTKEAGTLVLAVDASTSTGAFTGVYNESMTSGATIGGAGEALNSAAGAAFSWASGLPTGTVVTNIITPTLLGNQTNPYAQIDASLAPAHDSDATVLGYGVLGADTTQTTATPTFTSTQTYYLTAAALAGQLELGLVSGAAYGAVGDVTLTVTVGGVTELNIGYTSVAQMVTFCTDDVQDLGSFSSNVIPPGGLAVTITLTATTSSDLNTNSGFETNFLLGSSGVVSSPIINVSALTTVLGVGKQGPITGGVSVSEAGVLTGDVFTVNATDTHGDFNVTVPGVGGPTVTGQGTTALTIVGTFAQVNTELASLMDTSSTTGSDTIHLTATDTNGGSATPVNVAVTVNPPPVIVPITRVVVPVDVATTISGLNQAETLFGTPIAISEAGNTGAGVTFTVTLSDTQGLLNASQNGGSALITGQNTTGNLTISGSFGSVNDALAALTSQNITNASATFNSSDTITVNAHDGFGNVATQQTITVGVYDTAAQVEALTPTEIAQFSNDGVTSIPTFGFTEISVAQFDALENAPKGTMTIADAGQVEIYDNASQIETLTYTQMNALGAVGVSAGIVSKDASIVFNSPDTIETLAENDFGTGNNIAFGAPSGDAVEVVTDSTSIQTMIDNTIDPSGQSELPLAGLTEVTSDTSGITFTSYQAEAFIPPSPFTTPIHFGVVADDFPVSLIDSAASIEAIPIVDFATFNQIGITQIQSTTGPLTLSVAQAEAIANASLSVQGDNVTISDSAANIETMLDSGAGIVVAIGLFTGGVRVAANDGMLGLNAPAIAAVEDASANQVGMGQSPIVLGAPPGYSVTLSDTAADIEAIPTSELEGLNAIGIDQIVSTDTGVTLTAAQAIALGDPVSISVPTGDSVTIVDSEAAIEALTQVQIAQFAALGITGIAAADVSGAGPLFINGGITLSVTGAIPSSQTIDFIGTGGTLSVNDSPDMQGTVFGFTPVDAIDLTDAVYDGSATATLDPTTNIVTLIENSGTYMVQLDPNQLFLTTPTLAANPDAGTGTELTYTQPQVSSFNLVFSGQSVDGAVVSSGGEIDVQVGGLLNRGTILNGGSVLIEFGATLADAFIAAGGTLDVSVGDSASGAIVFGPVAGGSPGGFLQTDDNTMPVATIGSIVTSDTIDFTAIAFDPSGSTTLEAGNTLQFVENSTTYDLLFDPQQDFLNQGFTLSADAGTGTFLTETQSTVTTAATVLAGTYVDGAVIGSGGSVQVQTSATLNNGTVNGGVLSVATATALGTAVSFGASGGILVVGGTVVPTATVYGVGTQTTIDLAGIAYTGGQPVLEAGNELQLIEGSSTSYVQLDPTQTYTSSPLQAESDGATGTELSEPMACFLPGTRIRIDGGEVAVETLKVGDMIATLSGQTRRLCWIGTGRALATRGRRTAATPIIVRKGALGDNVPDADLYITKGHSLYIDGVLIPAEFLVNHRSIQWDDRAQEVTVYHLELDTHDILFANGTPAESYRDDGNRWLFQNANSGWDQPPKEPCAPVLTGGALVDTIWRRILDRTGPRPGIPLTDDPDLHLIVDGVRVAARRRDGQAWTFLLQAEANRIHVVSRDVVPAEAGFYRDTRSLGVALRKIAVWKGAKVVLFDAHDHRLVQGFHAYESESDLRWTNGYATLPADLFASFSGAVELVLDLASTTLYPDNGTETAREAA